MGFRDRSGTHPLPRRQKNHLIISLARHGVKAGVGAGATFYVPRCYDKRNTTGQRSFVWTAGCAAFQSERHEGKTRGALAEVSSWKRDSEFIPSRGAGTQ